MGGKWDVFRTIEWGEVRTVDEIIDISSKIDYI